MQTLVSNDFSHSCSLVAVAFFQYCRHPISRGFAWDVALPNYSLPWMIDRYELRICSSSKSDFCIKVGICFRGLGYRGTLFPLCCLKKSSS